MNIGLLLFIFCMLALAALKYNDSTKEVEKDPHLEKLAFDNGRMSKVQYEGHSYILWEHCSTGSFIHDPDCQCGKGNL